VQKRSKLTEKKDERLETLGKDTIFSAQQRFTIMFLLYLHKKAGFTELQKLLHLTPGNLDHHVRRLEEAGYVKTRHVLDWRPLKVIEISKLGSQEFRAYAVNLRKILEQVK
jgi:DNA-binding MarR family transcriptional regulator